MFKQIEILFCGLNWSCVDIYYINQDGNLNFAVEKETQYNINKPEQSNSENKIIGFVVTQPCEIGIRFAKFIHDISPKLVNSFFILHDTKQVAHAIRIIKNLDLGEFQLFGVDPDYYFSLVPLNGRNNRAIQKYVLSLKSDYSFIGSIKHFIKSILINLRLSNILYEKFIITVVKN